VSHIQRAGLLRTCFRGFMSNWVSQYIGVPFRDHGRDPSGWDCWGLVRWCLHKHFGVTVPSLHEKYDSVKDRKGIMGAVRSEKKRQIWRKVTVAAPGDVVLIRMRGVPLHVGICVGGTDMLHVMKSVGTVVEDFNNPILNTRVLGIYRYAG